MPEAVKDNDINVLYQKLNAIAQTGLTFSKDVFDTERYESLRQIAISSMPGSAKPPGSRRDPRRCVR